MSDNMNAGGSVGGIPAAAVGNFNDGPMPKASIGNYKGVMLCNRPNEFGQQRRPEPTGPLPFKSRVDPKSANPLGWNPCPKVLPKSSKKRSAFSGVLTRHKNYLKQLETAKLIEREDQMITQELEQARVNKFKDQAERQRKKIQQLKTDKEATALYEEAGQSMPAEQVEMEFAPEPTPEKVATRGAAKLTADALSQMDMNAGTSSAAPKQKSNATKSKKGSSKPAWAMTEKMMEEEKEKEIDDLLEFAYDLDYDKYMEDFEVKQAFEIIRDRIQEIKQDQDWKEKIADEWNKTVEEEQATGAAKPADQRSVYTYKTNRSKASQASFKSQVAMEKKKIAAEKPEWDRSTVASEARKKTVEEKIASKIANDVLKDNQKLRGVHSKESMKKILEREAKRQLLAETNGGVYNPPTVARVELRAPMNNGDPSNLPHLHKCPYV